MMDQYLLWDPNGLSENRIPDILIRKNQSPIDNTHFDSPLPRGTRPLWGMRVVLERMARHHQLRLTGSAVSELEARNWVLTLRLLAMYVDHTQKNNTKPDRATLLQSCSTAPLVWGRQQVIWWERERPWNKAGFGVYEGHAEAYAACMDERASEAYQVSTATTPIWNSWLDNAGADDLISLFLESAEAWQIWLERQQQRRGERPAEDRLETLDRLWAGVGRHLGLDDEAARIWAISELWWRAPTKGQESILLHVLKGLNFLVGPWMDLVGPALIGPSSTAQNFLGEQSLRTGGAPFISSPYPDLVVAKIWGSRSPLRIGPISVVSDAAGPSGRLADPTDWTAVQAAWTTHNWRWFRQRLIEAENDQSWMGGDQFLSEVVFSSIRREVDWVETQKRTAKWAHLSGMFERINASLLSRKPLAILVVGECGAGKSTMAEDLADCSGRAVIKPLTHPSERAEETPEKQAGRALTWINATAGQADSAAVYGVTLVVLDGLGVLDPSKLSEDLRRYFVQPNVALIFTTTDPAALPKDILGQFDIVVPLEKISLQQRLVLARRLFPNEELALRAARALRSVRTIQQASAWCDACGDWSWAAVQSQQQGIERGRRDSTSQGAYEEPVDLSGQENTPWVGYEHLQEVSDRLCRGFENPTAYERLGGKVPRGAILVGPPGTGKTLFARAIARRLDVPLLAPSTAQMIKHPERVRDVMMQARRMAPCVLLLDEAADMVNIGGKLTEALLAELDGADPLEGVLVIATLNCGMLHPAMVRPGRLHEVHSVDIPGPADRLRIWMAYLERLPCDARSDSWNKILVRASRGFAGSDIAECVRRAGGEAAGAGEDSISLSRLTQACDAIAWTSPSGGQGGRSEDRWCTAIHESGHAFLAWRYNLEVLRVTVRPRGGALGMTAWDHEEDNMERTRQDWHGVVQMALGGIAAEEAIFGSYGSGGSGDLRAVLTVLHRVITDYGMGHLGPVSGGLEFSWSDRRRRDVEDEVGAWAQQAFDEARDWCRQHSKLLTEMAKNLLVERDLSGEELDPWRKRVRDLADTRPAAPRWQTCLSGDTWPTLSKKERGGDEKEPRPTLHHDGSGGDR